MVRDAVAADAAAIASIFNPIIAATSITFRTAPVTPEERAAWIAGRQAGGFAVLVAEHGRTVAGYAAYGPFRAGDGYALSVEHSIHLADAFRGRGIGRELMAALTRRAAASGFHAMIGAITAENKASRAFHAAIGFQPVGLLPQVGHKFGRWLDLEFWQIRLDGRSVP